MVAKNGRYGPYVTELLPEDAPKKAKPRTGSLFKDMSLDTIDLEQAVRLLSLPRVVGDDAEGVEITAQNGRYGPYLKKGTDSRSLETEQQLFDITLDQALAIYAQPKQRGRAAAAAPLKELGNDPVSGAPVVVKAGRFGEYVTDGEYNATLRKDDSVEAITLERAAELLAERRAKGPAKKAAKRGAKKPTPRSRDEEDRQEDDQEGRQEVLMRRTGGSRRSLARVSNHGSCGLRRPVASRLNHRGRPSPPPPRLTPCPIGSPASTPRAVSSSASRGARGPASRRSPQLLRERLEADGHVVLLTREPGATPVGAEVRHIVLDPATGELADRTEALLYAADKAEHIHAVVGPGARARRGRDHRPLRRLDPRLPGRRPVARRRRAGVGRPLGHRRPAPPPDGAARPRAERTG